jgi:very-short-patch-repair endonuclease
MSKKYDDGKHILSNKPFSLIELDNEDVILQKLDKVAKQFDKKYILNKALMIENLIRYNVEGDWVVRLENSDKYKRDSSSMDSLIVRYGEDVGKKLYEDKLKKSTITEEMYIEKYGEVEGRLRWKELCKSKASFSEQFYVDKFGEEEGKRKWETVKSKKVKNWSKNLKDGKFKTWLSLDEYQQKYGVDIGYKKWATREMKRAYFGSKQYLIDKYGKEAGEIICKDIKNNVSLDKFIERYGEDVGRERYNENCKKCAVTLPKMVEKYGEIEGIARYKEWKTKITPPENKLGVSKSSQYLFWGIYEKLDNSLKSDVYFYELNEEYRFFHHLSDTIKLYKVDFKLGKKIIEFDCDYWHNSENDSVRDVFLTSAGYQILRVNYKEYMKDKSNVIDKCVEYLNG